MIESGPFAALHSQFRLVLGPRGSHQILHPARGVGRGLLAVKPSHWFHGHLLAGAQGTTQRTHDTCLAAYHSGLRRVQRGNQLSARKPKETNFRPRVEVRE